MESPPVLRPSDRDNQPLPAQQQGKPPVEGWEQIRALDEVENWAERTRVVSRQDHQYYTECAQEFIHDLVDSMPADVERAGIGPGDEQQNEFQYMNEFSDQDFQGSAVQLDVDYLEKVSSTTSEPSALARQSLYVKFDPLVGGGSPRGRAGHTPLMPAVARAGSSDLLMLDTPPQDRSVQSTAGGRARDLSHSSPTPSNMSSVLAGQSTPHSLSSTSSHLNSTLLDGSPVLQHPAHITTPTPTPRGVSRVPESDELVKVLPPYRQRAWQPRSQVSCLSA